MSREKGTKAWRLSGRNSRFIDSYIKEDTLVARKAKRRKRKNLDVDEAVERLMEIAGL